MKKLKPGMLPIYALIVSFSCFSTLSAAGDDGLADRLHAAMNAPDRAAADKARDPDRKPDQVLSFLGVKRGMTAIDLIAGGGYYTELLAAAVGPDGRVYSQNTDRLLDMRDGVNRKAIEARFADNRLPNAEIWLRDIPELGLENTADFALLSLNLHDLYIRAGEDGTVEQLQVIRQALKPGGILGVIDHAGVSGQDNNSLHRIEPELLEKLLLDAGFTIEARSDLLANPDDDYSKNVFAPEVRGKTDRIIIRAIRSASM